MKHFNGLTPAQAERLALLAEELGEAVQVIGKILRHGLDSSHPDAVVGDTNRRELERELGDVSAATTLLVLAGDLDLERIDEAENDKLERVGQYLHHQEYKS